MQDYLLYHTPGSCSRIALNALEEIGQPHQDRTVALMRGEQYEPAFRAINPRSKVPVLIVGATSITELPVILYYLSNAHPAAGLLPQGEDGRALLSSLSDVVWIAGTLHPLASRMLRPQALTDTDSDGVRAKARASLVDYAGGISMRLAETGWWYGRDWSVADMFIEWVYSVALHSGFDLSAFPVMQAHAARVRERPSFVRARAVEIRTLARDGLVLPPGIVL